MKNTAIVTGLVLCALSLAASAQAQMGRPQVPTPKGIFNPVVGSGAQYEIDNGDGAKTILDLAIVGKESAEGKDAYWFEMSFTDPRMGLMVAKDLLVVDGNSSHIAKMVMMMPGRGPIELPMSMSGRMPMAQTPEDIRDKAVDLGSESVTVPAGTFTCEHYRGKDKDDGTDVWVSKDVPPYGLVKMTNRDKSQTIVLVKTEKNVQDKITGTPVPFNPMAFGAPPQ